MLQGEIIMKCVKDRLFKRIWTVLLALMITVSFTPAVIFSESGADGAGQPAQTEQAGVKDGGGSTEKETAVDKAVGIILYVHNDAGVIESGKLISEEQGIAELRDALLIDPRNRVNIYFA